ncbi:MAG: class I SAM-dependent methyltransferase [Nibricoccus sp.]
MIRFLHSKYRKTRTWLLIKQPVLLTPLFFYLVESADKLLRARNRKTIPLTPTPAWKEQYQSIIARSPKNLSLSAASPAAYESDDYKNPRGAVNDCSTNPRFNQQVSRFFAGKSPLYILDLGCAGGGMVRSFLNQGHFAIGLEGSDAPKKHKLWEWAFIPEHLFTCDITQPWAITCGDNAPVLFDLVTAWEVMEHIPESKLEGLLNNIFKSLTVGGVFICSIDFSPDGNPLRNSVYHQTVKPYGWWANLFVTKGFQIVDHHPFAVEDFVRGNGLSIKDWHPADGTGAHFILRKL